MTKDELQKLHKEVYDLFNYQSDKKTYGVYEDWRSHAATFNEGKEFTDDCDGFAMTMCELLIERGVPRENIKFIVCDTEDGVPHGVAGVDLDGETYISENRFKKVFKWKTRRKMDWKYYMPLSEPGQWYKVE